MRAGLALRDRLLDLADAGVPAEAALLDLSWGMQRTKLMGALVTTGLADAFGDLTRDPVEVARELGLDPNCVVDVVGRFANTSAASIPIALSVASAEGRLAPGATVLLAAFGAGLVWGGTVVTWRPDEATAARPTPYS
jgi:hypothetical protein